MRPSFFFIGLAILAATLRVPARAQDAYGARGLFPVYQSGGQWLIFDKPRGPGTAEPLLPGGRFLVVGSAGADLFVVARTSATYGAVCRDKRAARLRAALLKGPRSSVGDPVLAIKVPDAFALKGSNARYQTLENMVDEALYQSAGPALIANALEEAQSGTFRFRSDDEGSASFLSDPRPEKVTLKIDFAARPKVAGLASPMVLVTGTQISSSYRRCLRLLEADKLVGSCVAMPHDLMAETAQLRFVSYDPGGKGNPFLLAYTRGEPLWGHERWGFILRASGAQMFLRDALNPNCREGF